MARMVESHIDTLKMSALDPDEAEAIKDLPDDEYEKHIAKKKEEQVEEVKTSAILEPDSGLTNISNIKGIKSVNKNVVNKVSNTDTQEELFTVPTY
jgi:hypothetical protein